MTLCWFGTSGRVSRARLSPPANGEEQLARGRLQEHVKWLCNDFESGGHLPVTLVSACGTGGGCGGGEVAQSWGCGWAGRGWNGPTAARRRELCALLDVAVSRAVGGGRCTAGVHGVRACPACQFGGHVRPVDLPPVSLLPVIDSSARALALAPDAAGGLVPVPCDCRASRVYSCARCAGQWVGAASAGGAVVL